MSRPKKDGKYFNCLLDRNTMERLEYYADMKGQTKTMAVERILKEFLDSEGVPKEIYPETKTSLY